MPTVLRNGRIYTPEGADLTAMLVDGDTIAWMGTEDGVGLFLDASVEVVDLDDCLVTPAFVDAHVHTTATGLALGGLDLRTTRSAQELLDRVAAYARSRPGRSVLGTGWDEDGWPDRQLPTAAQLSSAAGGQVYLSRVDGHSALVSADLLATLSGGDRGFSAGGFVQLDAHDSVREAAFRGLSATDRQEAQRRSLTHAASLGIGSVHEMAGPSISSEADLVALLELASGPDAPGVEVAAYWAELGAVERAATLGALGAGGDLFCDGSLGSHTAALHAPYADTGWLETPRFSAEEIAEHILACTRQGLQAGFHAIGDAAVDAILDGMELASVRDRSGGVRTAGHRLEHAEMVNDAPRLGRSGLIASVQPAFDATWGAAGGMYEQRLGASRSASMNDFAAMLAAGTAVAFGSDSPVTPLAPWAAVQAAAYHHRHESSISVRAAFAAHTRGGWRAARRDHDGSGVLTTGSPATYAVWDSGELVIDVPDERVSRWSTDPRAAVAGLPDLAPGSAFPACVRTVVRGRTAFDSGRL